MEMYRGLDVPQLKSKKPTFYMSKNYSACVILGSPTGKLLWGEVVHCAHLSCKKCVYGIVNISTSIDYLLSLDIITKEQALKLSLDSVSS